MTLPPHSSQYFENIFKDEFGAFQEALSQSASTSIRTNPYKKAEPSFGTLQTVPWCKTGYYLEKRPSFTLDPLFHAGAYYVQEASSMFVGYVFEKYIPKNAPLRVLDLCAAPGGKTTHLASFLGKEDLLVANEVIKSRVGILKENLTRWGAVEAIVVNQDPETFSDLEGFFDVVLVDAPCSGEGMFRKNPEAIKEWSEENVKVCAARQKRILSAAAMLVAPGGHLIYSTCTYNTEENQSNAKWLTRTLDFAQIDIETPEEWGITHSDGGVQFFPHKIKGEGFYLALFQSKARGARRSQNKPPLDRLQRNQTEAAKAWLQNGDDFEYYLKKDGNIVVIRTSLLNEIGTVLRKLQKRSTGFEIGLFKGKDFIPSHQLAMSGQASLDIPRIELDNQNALKFLKREAFELESTSSGWALVTHQNLELGWVKVIGGRVNNYLPTEWRIKMDLPQNED